MRVVLSNPALTDLAEIAAFIASDNAVRARSFSRELRAGCRELGGSPLRYALAFPDEDADLRRRPYGNYGIYYRAETDRVFVLRVLHRARNARRLLFAG